MHIIGYKNVDRWACALGLIDNITLAFEKHDDLSHEIIEKGYSKDFLQFAKFVKDNYEFFDSEAQHESSTKIGLKQKIKKSVMAELESLYC